MYTTLISPKVYTKETDLTYRKSKTKKNPVRTGSSGSSGGGVTPTPPETFYLLTEDDFFMMTENDNNISI